MTWLRVHVREEDDEEEAVGLCGISHATVRELGLVGEGPFVVSLYKPRTQTKDNVPHECVDEPVHREILASAHAFNYTEETVNIYVPLSLSQAHGLYTGEFVHVRAVDGSVLGLDRVVLTAFTMDALHEATGGIEETKASPQFKEKIQTFPIVVAQGSIISLPTSSPSSSSSLQNEQEDNNANFYRVFDCQPFLQGLIVPSTEILILPPKERPPSNTEQKTDTQPTQSDTFYVSSFILPTYSSDPLFRIGKSSSSIPAPLASPPSPLPPSNLYPALLGKPLEVPHPDSCDRDPLYEVGVTLKTLRHFHIFSGALVELVSHATQHKVVANIFAIDYPTQPTSQSTTQFQDYTLYLSPLLAFNLGLDPTFWLASNSPSTTKISIEKVIKPLKKDKPPNTMANPASSSSTTSPPYPISPTSKSTNSQTASSPPTPFLAESYPTASRVTLTRIKGPVTNTRANELRQFFKNPRLLKVGDLIGITIKHGLLESLGGDDEDLLDDEVQEIPASPTVGSWESDYASTFSSTAFFRVSSLSVGPSSFSEPSPSPLAWVLRGETMVEQRGAVHATLPTLARSYLVPHPFFSSTHPLALDPDITGVPCVRGLLDVLRPALYPMSHELGLSFSVLVSGPSGSGKETAIRQVADLLGANLVELDCYEIAPSAHPSASQIETALRSALSTAQDHAPCVLVLHNLTFLDVVAQQQQQQQGGSGEKKGVDLVELMEQLRQETQGTHHLMLVGTVEKADKLSPAMRTWFRHEVEVAPPDESSRESILAHSLARFGFHHHEQIQHLAKQTVSLFPRDLHSLVAHATLAAKKRVLRRLRTGDAGDHAARNRSIVAAGVSISSEDLTAALTVLQAHHATAIGAPKVPDVKWDDVGGLGEAKKEILDTIQIPLLYPWLFSSGITPRSGILLFGPPGTGKTLLAKAVATECKLNFLSVKGPELINMYVGESERNIREIFQKARDARPCVIFFDELDSLAPKRGQGADSGGVMDRIVSQFLTELNGLRKSPGLFVMGATNRPDLIDDALLIPGRFDRKVYLGISSSRPEQVKIMKALTRKFNLGESVNLDEIAEACPTTLTGADFYALCADAYSLSMKEYITKMTSTPPPSSTSPSSSSTSPPPSSTPAEDELLVVEQRHFKTAQERLKPSVSTAELDYYRKLQEQFRNKKKGNS